ncbi:putative ferredoxin, 2Fe-2S type, ISC system [Candidatus Nasuia deltocephalinicola str. NAS-ALF]|uniref:Ferredoxin, 2Fe-2S type, ISC system n=1 Tax=Candidatus Nasuia deltocephalinicola str. NAS-ALF TaxID=1343077 RepID=S5SQJ0_9PROT|nr:putative ferredoxin, 2Fe-2S type, ISC system [Candidatus Nasuia deltocephalinicola str. NAS-ALF]
MKKIIILANKNSCYNGKIIRYFKKNISICKILIENNLEIKNNCNGFNICNYCKIKINEGIFFIRKKYFNSCQIFDFVFNNIIITI